MYSVPIAWRGCLLSAALRWQSHGKRLFISRFQLFKTRNAVLEIQVFMLILGVLHNLEIWLSLLSFPCSLCACMELLTKPCHTATHRCQRVPRGWRCRGQQGASQPAQALPTSCSRSSFPTTARKPQDLRYYSIFHVCLKFMTQTLPPEFVTARL